MSEHEGCGCHKPTNEKEQQEKEAMRKRLGAIRNKILVLSGKGGVGKSTVAVNLAASLALAGNKVGLLDIDIHGPSIPTLLHLEGKNVEGDDEGIIPINYSDHLKVMSIGFLMQKNQEAVIWRGPMKHSVIKQFLTYVNWGELDYLVVDSPPGTGDEPLSIAQFMAKDAQAVIVTTPQEVALTDVRKSINFCRKLSLPIMGIIENMSGYVCPHCNKTSDIFKSGGGQELALSMEVPFMGKIPLEPGVVLSSDDGKPYVEAFKDSATSIAFREVIKSILEMDK
ncbi:MAG: Mrp/NBP35 family ATP-binding protein [Planctomycetes bacterium]|nr:Mrp/NBP35 family ATP-binding protein [Planctomycetota bacterium]